jgi:glutamate synthase (NADPH/NADH) small chain
MKAHHFPEYDTPVKSARRVAVIGGGNVAMDSARTALRLGAEKVSIIYRRTEREMPSRLEEIENAREEGIDIYFLSSPLEAIGNTKGWVRALRCERMTLGEPDSSGRCRPVPSGKEFTIKSDSVNKLNLWGDGYIVADRDGRTNLPGIFAGGDITTGAATVISAMGAGKRAARAIDDYIIGRGASQQQTPEKALLQSMPR